MGQLGSRRPLGWLAVLSLAVIIAKFGLNYLNDLVVVGNVSIGWSCPS